jgi:ATP-binding cassette subfamily C protein
LNIGAAAYRHAMALGRRWRGRMLTALLALLANAFVEGAGLLLLVPLLAVVGIDVRQGPIGRLSALVSAAFSRAAIVPTLPAVLAVFVAANVILAILRRTCWLVGTSLEQDVTRDGSERLYDAIAHMEWTRFTKLRASDLSVALTTECERAGQASALLLNICGSAVVAAVYVAFAARVSAMMTAVVLGCSALLALLLHRRARRSADLGAAYSNALREFQAAVTDDLGGMKTIRSGSAENRSAGRIARLARALAAVKESNSRHYANATLWLDIGSAVMLSGLLLVAINALRFDAAATLLLLFLFARVVPRIGALNQNLQLYVNLLPAVERVASLETHCRAAAAPRSVPGAPMPLRRQLRFERVSFRYAPQEPWILHDVDLTIEAGTTVAIVGPSGAGKTTLVDLMIGLLAPEAGRLTVDGTVLAENAEAWRTAIGYVSQEPFLFHDTVRANVAWGRPGASDADIHRALELALADFVNDLPDGLDTVVGDRGVRLSGGQRQRIALARALLRKPSLLIMDEATNSIDVANERRILAAVNGLHGTMTIVMITHRLADLPCVDTVLTLDDGRFVESTVPA